MAAWQVTTKVLSLPPHVFMPVQASDTLKRVLIVESPHYFDIETCNIVKMAC